MTGFAALVSCLLLQPEPLTVGLASFSTNRNFKAEDSGEGILRSLECTSLLWKVLSFHAPKPIPVRTSPGLTTVVVIQACKSWQLFEPLVLLPSCEATLRYQIYISLFLLLF